MSRVELSRSKGGARATQHTGGHSGRGSRSHAFVRVRGRLSVETRVALPSSSLLSILLTSLSLSLRNKSLFSPFSSPSLAFRLPRTPRPVSGWAGNEGWGLENSVAVERREGGEGRDAWRGRTSQCIHEMARDWECISQKEREHRFNDSTSSLLFSSSTSSGSLVSSRELPSSPRPLGRGELVSNCQGRLP